MQMPGEQRPLQLIPWINNITKDLISFCQICLPKCEILHKFHFLPGSKRDAAFTGFPSAVQKKRQSWLLLSLSEEQITKPKPKSFPQILQETSSNISNISLTWIGSMAYSRTIPLTGQWYAFIGYSLSCLNQSYWGTGHGLTLIGLQGWCTLAGSGGWVEYHPSKL